MFFVFQVHQTLEPHFDSDVFTVDPSKEIVLKLTNPLLLKGDVKLAVQPGNVTFSE